ncbi:MAG TPA: tagaturonate reductase [Longimicrobiaceae bacterium]|jgi:tagaturonate reductase|nr:tagaturonate reductase [Longimicrobiaceae bacterium]
MPSLPALSRELVCSPAFQARTDVSVPAPELLSLPERAVQFGTGAFLRGFVDYFIDEANRQGRFGGRVVMVGSTGSGRDGVLNEQDGLYTLAIQGVEGGEVRREHRVVGSVSRALSARGEWTAVLEVARSPELEVVFSNTTEVGIALDEGDEAEMSPPRSFPGKLARFLYERGRAFAWNEARGVVVVPCELIDDNGDRLRAIVLQLGERWGFGAEFARWIESAVPFCNTLVDRIVPGAPSPEVQMETDALLGYRDALLTSCEVYRLFAIQGDGALAERLRFPAADPRIIVAADVSPYRERKVRLLNGSHTVTTPAALLCGCETVLDAVEHELVGPFLSRAMLEEIVPSLDAPGAEVFAQEVLDRFANPFIRHALVDITLQQTMKVRVRIVPSVVRYAEKAGRVPQSLAFGFAAYLLYMRGDMQADRQRAGLNVPADDQGAKVRDAWLSVDADSAEAVASLVQSVVSDEALWGAELAAVPGFADAVATHLQSMLSDGVPAALEAHLAGAAQAA